MNEIELYAIAHNKEFNYDNRKEWNRYTPTQNLYLSHKTFLNQNPYTEIDSVIDYLTENLSKALSILE